MHTSRKTTAVRGKFADGNFILSPPGSEQSSPAGAITRKMSLLSGGLSRDGDDVLKLLSQMESRQRKALQEPDATLINGGHYSCRRLSALPSVCLNAQPQSSIAQATIDETNGQEKLQEQQYDQKRRLSNFMDGLKVNNDFRRNSMATSSREGSSPLSARRNLWQASKTDRCTCLL